MSNKDLVSVLTIVDHFINYLAYTYRFKNKFLNFYHLSHLFLNVFKFDFVKFIYLKNEDLSFFLNKFH